MGLFLDDVGDLHIYKETFRDSDVKSLGEEIRQKKLDLIKARVIDAEDTEEKQPIEKSLGKAIGEYMCDLPKKHKPSSIFEFGESRSGKTLCTAGWIKRRLDPTFIEEFEKRYFIGDQYDKLANYYEMENIASLAFMWDEIGIGLYSEDHAKTMQKQISKLSQISAFKYPFFFALTTWPKLITSNVKSQFKLLLEAVERMDKYKVTKFNFKENIYAKRYTTYGETVRYIKEIDFRLPSEYTKNTVAQGRSITISPFYLHLPTKRVIRIVEDVERRWKMEYSKGGADEMRGMASTKRTDSSYDQIAEKVLANLEGYMIRLPRSRKLDKMKIREEFAVSDKEYNKIYDSLRFRLNKGGFRWEDIKR